MTRSSNTLNRAVRLWRREGLAGFLHRLAVRTCPRLGLARRWEYSAWLRWNEPDEAGLAAQTLEARERSAPPLISVLVEPGGEAAALASDLARQSYPFWELVVANVTGQRPDPAIEHAARRDPRVLIHRVADNGLAAAVALAHGELVALVERGARLSPQALFEVTRAFAEQGSGDVFFGDNDRLTPRGRRIAPWFKPAWSPEMLLSVDYLGPLRVVRRELLSAVAPRCWPDRAEWWELGLRLAETGARIVHIPHVIAHALAAPITTGAKDGIVPVGEHLRRRALDAEAALSSSGQLHCRWSSSGRRPAAIIVPTRDRLDLLRRCLDSVRERSGDAEHEVIVVDNDSREDEMRRYLDQESRAGRLRVIQHPGEFNWGALNNAAARSTEAETLVFLNNDVEVMSEDWLTELTAWTRIEEIALVGPLLLRADGTIQHAGVFLGLGGVAAHPFEHLRPPARGAAGRTDWYRNVIAVTGACLAVRRSLFVELGGFDEELTALFSDVELGVRAWRAGRRSLVNPHVVLLHHHGSTRGGDERMPPHDFLVAMKRFGDVIQTGDPYFNPNLSRWSVTPALRRRGERDAWAWFQAFAGLLKEEFAGSEARRPQLLGDLARRAWHLAAGRSVGKTPSAPS